MPARAPAAPASSHSEQVRPVHAALAAACLGACWLAWPSFPDAGWLVALALGVVLLVPGRLAPAIGAPVQTLGRVRAYQTDAATLGALWAVAGAAAGAIAFALTLAVPGGLLIVLYGLLMALPEGLILRRRLRGGGWWVFATAGCWPIAAMMGLEFLYLAGPMGPLAGGFAIGAVQWLILAYGNGLRRAGWWVAASMLAWTLDCWIVLAGASLLLPADLAAVPAGSLILIGAAVGGAGGAAYAAVSGAALLWLLQGESQPGPGATGALTGLPDPDARGGG